MTTAPTRPAPSKPAPTRPAQTQAKTTPQLSMAAPAPITPRAVLYAVEGWGKTSALAHAAKSAIIMGSGETGYDTLLSGNRVPRIPRVLCESWEEDLAIADSLIADQQGLDIVFWDSLGTHERLCHDFVCRTRFGGDWGEHGFLSFNKGYDIAVSEWLKLLAKLDQLNQKGVTIVLLGHSKVKPFKNPLGADFDRYICDVHEKTWAATARWADAVMFGNFSTIVEASKREERKNVAERKGKGIGGTDRLLYTERRDGFDAKNRYGMPECLEIGNDPSQVWAQIWSAITGTEAAHGS